ncbi:MAG: prephenate dehydrogenase/arogenate dehydrogenase family protein [bacterium]
MLRIAIIGFGRFGQTWYEILKNDFQVLLFDKNKKNFAKYPLAKNTLICKTAKEAYQADVVFYAVPITQFEKVIQDHLSHILKQKPLLIDLLSVKVFPQKIFTKYLKNTNIEAMLLHPMFGPDSIRIAGLENQPLIIDPFRSTRATYKFWHDYFENKKLKVIKMTATEHDKLAAKSQGVTHFIGRLLEEYKLEATPIDSLGSKKLREIMDQTCHDTWELFEGLQNYNPYTKAMRINIGTAYNRIFNKLLPHQVNPNHLTFGIQGGIASFNEEAIMSYITSKKIEAFSLKYLYTSENVLKNLHDGTIDFGIFAIQNSVGGIVDESIVAMANYKFKIVEEVKIPVRHFLMRRKDCPEKIIKQIMGHPQVFKQCTSTLQKRFPQLKQVSGTGNLIDTAYAAKALAEGRIAKTTAILGPKRLSELYDFAIIAENLQDDSENITSFLVVERK